MHGAGIMYVERLTAPRALFVRGWERRSSVGVGSVKEESLMRDVRQLVPALLIVGSLFMPMRAGAQDATPAPDEASPVPRMMLPQCTAEPGDIKKALALWFNAAGTPQATPVMAAPITDLEALPQGERPDDATEKAITDTTLNWFSCLEVSGQPARAYSYMTDHFLAQFGPDLTNPAQNSSEKVRAALEQQLAGTPVPTTGMESALVGPRRARVLDDGRVGAVWSLHGNRFFLVYKQVDSKWLIDDAIDVVDVMGTPVAATPAP
jgi:hypothetical protein